MDGAMKIDEILEVIKDLARSQGFYGRLYESFMRTKENSPEEWSEIVEALESEHFKEPLDVVLYFEQ